MVNSLKIDEQTKNKYTLDDWHYINCLRFQCSEAQNNLASKTIEKSRNICDVASVAIKTNRDETNLCLEERIKEIEFCKQELTRNRNELILELDALLNSKDRLVESLSSLRQNALEICMKCLSARKCRIGIDLVNDNVEKELRIECERIKCADHLMTSTLEQTLDQIRLIKSTLYYINRDLEDKENNLRIDRHNSTLKETNLNLSIYQGKSALDASGITIEEWEMQTKKNIESSAKEILSARKIRSGTDHVLKQITTQLNYQKTVTDVAFKQRIQETKDCKEKFELRHSEIMHQVNLMTKNITQLEKIIAEKEGFIALAHTRLGNRCQRPGLELTCDRVEKCLTKEVSDLREFITHLQQTLFEAQASLRFLLKMQIQLEEDINIKTNTLKIDEVDCLTMHQTIEFRVF